LLFGEPGDLAQFLDPAGDVFQLVCHKSSFITRGG
jgi:hypothetical protein